MHHRAKIAALIGLVCLPASIAQAQLRIVNYNTNNLHNSTAMTDVMRALGRDEVNGVAKAPDAIFLQEQDTLSGVTTPIVNILNGLYGAGTYARGVISNESDGGGHEAIIYNTKTLTLIQEIQVGVTSSAAATRAPMRYRLRPIGYDSAADFYVYNSHFKAGNEDPNGGAPGPPYSDAERRNGEALTIRQNTLTGSNLLGDAHVIYTGDFNVYTHNEAMWATLTGAGNGQAFDPVNQVGSWSNSFLFKQWHTQSPVSANNEYFGGQVGGGMDDRFDFQLITGELQDNEGMSYITGSYHGFGNNGSHNWNSGNSDINDPSNTALNELDATWGSGYGASVRLALAQNSDHIPVVAQYQVPAKMAVFGSTVPTQVIVGASLNMDVIVANTAGEKDPSGNNFLVTAANGADELDYTIVASGDSSGSVNGTKAAEVFNFGTGSAHGNSHGFGLSTSGAGDKYALFEITATSPQVPDSLQYAWAEYSVLDHANASFLSGSDQNTLTIDFGDFAQGSGDQTSPFSINNLVATAGFTAALDSILYSGSGDTGVLTTDLTAISNLVAGSDLDFNAIFDTSTPGNYSATYTLTFSDDTAILGATSGTPLTLTLLGDVIGSADADFDDDSDVDADDIDILADMIFRGASDPGGNDTADLDGVGGVTQDDMDYMVSTVLETVFGDSDLDDDVDGADFDAWRIRDSEGGGIGWATGDWDGDNDVDGADFDHWRERLPAIGGAGLSAVPEPATVVLLGLALPGLGLIARRRRGC